MIGTKITKPLTDYKLYAKCAKWCNENQGKIVEHDNYYEVVDNTPTEEELNTINKGQLLQELKIVTEDISQLNGASMCGYSVDNEMQYDIVKDGCVVTLTEQEFNDYFDDLTDKRNEIVKQLKGL